MELTDELFEKELFESLKTKYLNNELTKQDNILKGKIEPANNLVDKFPETDTPEFNKYKKLGETAIENNEFAVAIVNGGMATRFGGVVKGIVDVFDNKSFLQLKIENIKYIANKYNTKIQVFIMNSISTHDDTVKHFENNNYFGYDKNYIKFFNQFMFKRLLPDGTLLDNKDKLLYGCGHGDFYFAFKKFVYPEFKDSGIKYLYYSNVDNLGAYIDPVIIGYHISKNNPITVEVAEKYKGDKGGAPALVDNNLQIVEGFKFPETFDQDSISVFNTASYVFSMDIFEKNIQLPFYVVEKNVDDKKVIQFERLAGDLTIFFNSNFLIIDREKRFFPIKTREDLTELKFKIKNVLKNKLL